MNPSNSSHEILEKSALLIDSPESLISKREHAEIPLSDEGDNFVLQLLKTTTTGSSEIKADYNLLLHALRGGELLGIHIPPVMGNICSAWERDGRQIGMYLEKGTGVKAPAESLAALIDAGLLENPETATRTEMLSRTLEEFSVLHVIDKDFDPGSMEEDNIFIFESNRVLQTIGQIGTVASAVYLERYSDAAILEVSQQTHPQKHSKETTVRIKTGDSWICYEEPEGYIDLEHEAKIKVYKPALPSGLTKRIIDAQVDVELGEDASILDKLKGWGEKGGFNRPSLEVEYYVKDASELLSEIETVMTDAIDNDAAWTHVDSSSF